MIVHFQAIHLVRNLQLGQSKRERLLVFRNVNPEAGRCTSTLYYVTRQMSHITTCAVTMIIF